MGRNAADHDTTTPRAAAAADPGAYLSVELKQVKSCLDLARFDRVWWDPAHQHLVTMRADATFAALGEAKPAAAAASRVHGDAGGGEAKDDGVEGGDGVERGGVEAEGAAVAPTQSAPRQGGKLARRGTDRGSASGARFTHWSAVVGEKKEVTI